MGLLSSLPGHPLAALLAEGKALGAAGELQRGRIRRQGRQRCLRLGTSGMASVTNS